MVPATTITSAWRGEARYTSTPKREKSCRGAPAAIISIPQQLVAKVSGHIEFDRPQLIRSSMVLRITLPPDLLRSSSDSLSLKSSYFIDFIFIPISKHLYATHIAGPIQG